MKVVVRNWGVVSPAGWGRDAFRQALAAAEPLPAADLPRPGQEQPLRVRRVPQPSKRPGFIAHARLRRTSPISQYVVASALEALEGDAELARENKRVLGIVFCATCGCVNYSRRFYDEAWKSPATASPLIFPETVFNAPASHLAALLGTTAITYTLVGDGANFPAGMAVAAHWLREGRVEGCLVVGAEESDWLTADAARLLNPGIVMSEGAGALYLTCERGDARGAGLAELTAITDPQFFTDAPGRLRAARGVRESLAPFGAGEFLCDGLLGTRKSDRAEEAAWADWTGRRMSPKRILGEGLCAASAWQCGCALDALHTGDSHAAVVSVAGASQQVIGARFERLP